MKQIFGTIVGVVVGAVGMLLFSKSLPPEAGSQQEQLEIAQSELQTAQRTIRVLEDRAGVSGTRNGRPWSGAKRTVGDGVRDVMQDIRDGKEVSMDDVFGTMKPWMRDMAPLFNRMREINQTDWADSMTGEWARKYNLDEDEKEALKEWFIEKNRERSEALEQVLADDTSGFVDWMRAVEYSQEDSEGLDDVMEGFLEGEELAQFQEERLLERTERVHAEADRGLARLDGIVTLEEEQQDQVFGVLVRGSKGYVDGGDTETMALDRRERDEEVRKLMRPDQLEALDAYRAERKAKAEKEMGRMGLSLPKDWDLLEQDTF